MATHLRPPSKTNGVGNAEIIVGALAAAAVIELAVLRTFTRTAVHIPALHALRSPYEVLTNAGEFAYFAALCLVVPALIAIGVVLVRDRHPQRYLIGFGLGSFLIPWTLVGVGLWTIEAMDAITIGAVCALAVAVSLAVPWRVAVPTLVFALAFAASAFHTWLPNSSFEGMVGQPGGLLTIAEFAGIAYAVSTPLLVPARADRLSRWLGVGAGGLVFVALLGNGSTSRFLLLWNAGLSGTLPAFVYAAAAGALVYTLVAAWRAKSPFVTAGVILLVAGGIGLHSTYQSSLVLAGLASLAVGTRREMWMSEASAVVGARIKPDSLPAFEGAVSNVLAKKMDGV